MSNVRVLATDLEFPEGPVVMPDGSVVLVEIRGRRLTRVWPDGRKEVVAEIPGGPNGAAARLGMKRTTLAYRIRKLNIPCRPL